MKFQMKLIFDVIIFIRRNIPHIKKEKLTDVATQSIKY